MQKLTQIQLHNSLGNRRYKRKEIKLNILLIGENGVGKKTFINTVCNQSVFEDDGILEKEEQSNEFSIESKILSMLTTRILSFLFPSEILLTS